MNSNGFLQESCTANSHTQTAHLCPSIMALNEEGIRNRQFEWILGHAQSIIERPRPLAEVTTQLRSRQNCTEPSRESCRLFVGGVVG